MTAPSHAKPSLRLSTVCIDCADSEEMVGFYSRLLGWEVRHRDGAFVIMRDPATSAEYSFNPTPGYRPPVWPERSDGQDKQMHFEILVEDLDAAVAHAVECGARFADHQGREDLRVMLDPAGHVFCLWT